MALKFNGTNQSLQTAATVDLSSTSIISLSFWLWWDAFANNDALGGETSSNFNSNNGALLINPNSSTTNDFQFTGHSAAGYFSTHFARPTANVWHHYGAILNISTGSGSVFLDGVSQSVTNSPGSSGSWGNFTLNLMSRNGASLWGAGRMAEFCIFKRALATSEFQYLYQGNSPLPLDAGNQLACYYKLDNQVPEKDRSQFNNFNNFVGSPTVVDGAPAILKAPAKAKRFPAAGVIAVPVFSYYITVERLQ